jgi:choline monooxygenase
MRPDDFRVEPDIRAAATPPRELYGDPVWFDAICERILARTWHVVARLDEVAQPESALPVTLLPGALDEPVVLTRDGAGALHALANVCTHRGNVVATEAGRARTLRCGYHGRTFRLDGSMLAAPGFEGATSFPSAADALRRFGLGTFGPLAFVAARPATSFDALVRPLAERLAFFPWNALRRDAEGSRDYEIDANWALYVDNYLEGFHVPFVHGGLAKTLDEDAYATELSDEGVLQVGFVAPGEPAFALPAGHRDYDRRVGAYWAWLFPATMLNLYPWGLSVNVVQPLGPSRTRVRYLTLVADASLRGKGAGGDLHRVEMEDQGVVLGVQRGMRSRLARPGRYAPGHERGVHHFHTLLARRLVDA